MEEKKNSEEMFGLVEVLLFIGIAFVIFVLCERSLSVNDISYVAIDSINTETTDFCDELDSYVANLYIEAAKEIYGDSYDDSKSVCDLYGLTYDDKFVSWEYLEEIAYNIMING